MVVDNPYDDEKFNAELHDFCERMLPYLRRRIGTTLGRRVSGSDILQTAIRSLLSDSKISLPDCRNLWALLKHKIDRKLVNVLRRHKAQKRSVDRETEVEWIDGVSVETQRPEDRLIFREEQAALDQVVSSLPEHLSQVVALKLQGLSNAETAVLLDRSERTVRRYLDEIRQELTKTN